MLLSAEKETYQIHLPQFEGPFDLLLFFIERDELDIYDIPISKVTNEFLTYIRTLERMNIEIASEFILMASTLMKIKSKLLIPRPTVNENGEIEDPRTELVNRLLEYKRYKTALEELRVKESEAQEQFRRAFAAKEEKEILQSGDAAEEELSGIDLYTIMRTYRRLMEKHLARQEKPRHVIRKYPYSTDDVKADILSKLENKEKIDFASFVLDIPEKIYCVFVFLAVLEMAQQGHINLVIGRGYNNFWLARAAQAA